jgi:hypothetical protein
MTFVSAALMVVRLSAILGIIAINISRIVSEEEALGTFARTASSLDGPAIFQIFLFIASLVSAGDLSS